MSVDRPAVSGPGEGERLEGPHRLGWVKALRPELHLVEFEICPEYGGRRPLLPRAARGRVLRGGR